MWYFTIREPYKEPRLVRLKPGNLSIGRSSNNDIDIQEDSASRLHAEVLVDSVSASISIVDLNSTNGTYVNQQRIHGAFQLAVNDDVRIGKTSMLLVYYPEEGAAAKNTAVETHLFTSELMHESISQYPAVLYEISSKLNTILDIKTAVHEVSKSIKYLIGVDKCEILVGKQLNDIDTPEFSGTLAQQAVKNRCAEVTPLQMFIPIISTEEVLGLIIIAKSGVKSQPFNRRDLQLVIAISHQAALTIRRMDLAYKLNHEEQVHRLLLRFVSPIEAEFVFNHYRKSGQLPPVREQKITVLFADIANSAGLAKSMGAAQFAQVLNNFYKNATEIAFKHDGIVKYLGDGVLVVFTEETSRWSSEERAISTGLELTRKIDHSGTLNSKRRIIIGAAINTGKAMAGYIGTDERAEFVTLGDTVNIAYRLQEYARPYKVIVGPATIAATRDKYQYERVGAITLNGHQHPVQAYEIMLPMNKNHNQILLSKTSPL